MNIVILNRFPLNKIHYYKWVSNDCNLYLFSTEQNAKTKSFYKESNFYSDYDNSERVILDIIQLSRRKRIDYIVALSEKDVLRAGYLRTYLDIRGLNKDITWAFRDKVAMKDKLSLSSVPVAKYSPAPDVTSILSFMKLNGNNIVLKPRREAGSRGVTVIKNDVELFEFLKCNDGFTPNKKFEWMVESFQNADLYHVDGIFSNRELKSCYVSKYITSCLGFNDNQPLISVLVNQQEKKYRDIRDITEKALNVLGENETTIFHAEIFLTEDGNVYVNEVACRIGGGKIYETLKLVCDYDILEDYFKYITVDGHNSMQSNKTKLNKNGGWVLVPPHMGKIKRLPGMFEYNWVIHQEIYGQEEQEISSARSSVDRIFEAIVSGDSTTDVIGNLEKITSDFLKTIKYY